MYQYRWDICGNLKVIQGGFTKYCFLCLWDSRATIQQYIKEDFPFVKVFLPPLLIKLGVMKNSSKPRTMRIVVQVPKENISSIKWSKKKKPYLLNLKERSFYVISVWRKIKLKGLDCLEVFCKCSERISAQQQRKSL